MIQGEMEGRKAGKSTNSNRLRATAASIAALMVASAAAVFWAAEKASAATGTARAAVVKVFGREFEARTMGHSWSFTSTDNWARFEVRPGEQYYTDDSRQRDELTECPFRSRLLTDPINASFEFKVKGIVASSDYRDYTIVHQIHQDRIEGYEDAISKPPALSIGFNDRGEFLIGVRGNPKVPAADASRVYTQVYRAQWRKADSWASVSYEAQLGPTGTGTLKVWLDGKLIVNRSRLVFGYSGSATPNRPQVQFGIYRSQFTTPLVVEQRNVVIAQPPGTACG